VLLLAALRKETQAFSSIHRLHGPASNIKYTERMYGDRKGPWGIGGRSTITVNTTAVPLHRNEVSDTITIHRLHDYFEFGVAVATFTDIEELTDLDEHSICARNFSDPLEGNRDGVLYGEFHPIAPNEKIQISTVFHPKLSGLQVVLITACWKQKSESFGYPVSTTEFVMYPMFDPLLCVNGSVSFENPYGYLPALLFGLFPFKYVQHLPRLF
jgi:hypothetical protein